MPFVLEETEITDIVDDNEWFLNCLLTIQNDPSSLLTRRLRGRLWVDGVSKEIRTATWTEGISQSSLQIELANVDDRTAFTRTAEIKFQTEEYLAGVWTLKKLYCDGAILATRVYTIKNEDGKPADAYRFTVLSVLQQKLNLTPDQIVVLHDPAKVAVEESQLELVPNIGGTITGTATVTPIASMTLQDGLDFLGDLYGCNTPTKTNLNASQWSVTRFDFPPAQPYWNTIAGEIGNHNPHIYIDADNYLVVKDGTLTDYLSARTMTVSNFENIENNDTIERFKGSILSRQLSSAAWDYYEFRQEKPDQWFGGVTGQYPLTEVEEWYQDFFKIGIAIPVFSQLAMYKEVEYLTFVAHALNNPSSATAQVYSYLFDQNGTRPIRTHSREWGFMNVPTSFATFNTTFLPHPSGYVLGTMGGSPELYSSTNNTSFTEALVLTKDENTYHAYVPIRNGTDQSYVSQTDTETQGLITTDTGNQQLGTDFEQPWGKAQENGNLVEGQNARWGVTDKRKEAQKAEKRRNVTLRTKRHSALNSTNGLIAENYLDRRKGDIGDSDIQAETKPVYITENGDPTASLWRSVNGGDAPLEILIPLAHRLNKSQDYPGGISADLPTYDETMAIGVVINPSNRAGISLGIHEVIGYTDEIRNVGDGGFQTKIQTRQIGEGSTPSTLSSVEDTFEINLHASSATLDVEKLINCKDGHTISLITGAVAGCVVQVKEETDVSWTNIETTPYDLTPFVGETKTFLFRFDPTAVTVTQQLTFRIGPA